MVNTTYFRNIASQRIYSLFSVLDCSQNTEKKEKEYGKLYHCRNTINFGIKYNTKNKLKQANCTTELVRKVLQDSFS